MFDVLLSPKLCYCIKKLTGVTLLSLGVRSFELKASKTAGKYLLIGILERAEPFCLLGERVYSLTSGVMIG